MNNVDLLEEDRFFLILSIRDLTFPEPESQLSVDHTDKKGNSHQVEVNKDNFTYFSVPENLEKYYSSEERSFLIETKSFGTLKMSPPTIGIMQKMTAYIKDRQEKNQNIDQSVLQIMPYLISEWRGFDDKDIFKFEMEMNSWSNKKYTNLFSLFKISLENFFKTKFYIYKHLHLQPSELEKMEYYEFHYLVKDLLEFLQKENDANQAQSEQGSDMASKMKVPNMKVPNMKIPSLR